MTNKIKYKLALLRSKISKKHFKACLEDYTGRPEFNCICGQNKTIYEILFKR